MKSNVNKKSYRAQMFLCLGLATTSVFAAHAGLPAVIPLPQEMTLRDGAFKLAANTPVHADSASRETANFLTAGLRPATGYSLKTGTAASIGTPLPGGILLTTQNADTNLGPEGYELTVAPDAIVVRASTQAGLFYGVQTLLQLLPPEIFSTNLVKDVAWQVPCVQIKDWPRFKWRGFMLDVSRHFFTKAEVETLLDAHGAA